VFGFGPKTRTGKQKIRWLLNEMQWPQIHEEAERALWQVWTTKRFTKAEVIGLFQQIMKNEL
jgi:hypothetical protein